MGLLIFAIQEFFLCFLQISTENKIKIRFLVFEILSIKSMAGICRNDFSLTIFKRITKKKEIGIFFHMHYMDKVEDSLSAKQ